MVRCFTIAVIWIATQMPLAALAQNIAGDQEREFQDSVARLLDAKTVRAESDRLVGPYRRAAHMVFVALGNHKVKGSHRDPLGLIEAARMLRAVECSRLLAEYVDTVSPAGFAPGPLGPYPAAQTLIEFGSPAYSGMFARLHGDSTEEQLRLFALIFIQIDGKRLAGVRVEQAIEEHITGREFSGEDQPYTKNLRRLLELVRIVDLSQKENWPSSAR